VPILESSLQQLTERLAGAEDSWLHRKIPPIGEGYELSGWRILMMLAEHDVHHRSQIDTYAGINGWEIKHIFDRTAESVFNQQDAERAKYARS
jgi:hypothetical protein